MDTDDGTSVCGPTLLPKQRGVVWILDVPRKFTSPGHTVVGICSRNFAPARHACSFRGIIVLLGAEMTPCFSNNQYMWL